MTFLSLHRKLGHTHYDALGQMIRNNTIEGFEDLPESFLKTISIEPCMDCAKAKIKQFAVKKKADRRTGVPFKTGSVDIWGPVKTPGVGGNRYGLMYCDNETSYGFVEFLSSKEFSELAQVFTKWKLEVRDLGFDMQRIQFDADSVFENGEMQRHLQQMGILSQFAPSGEHRANGQVEAMIRTIVYMARTMLLASGLPERYWPYAISYAMLIYNATMKKRFRDDPARQFKSPYEIVKKIKPLLDFPLFGALAVSRIPDANDLEAFAYRGRECVILGRDPDHHNAYILLNLATKMPIISKDVIINEHVYGYTMTRVDKIDPPIEDVDKEWSQAVLVTPAGDSLPSSEGGNVVDVVDNTPDATESAFEPAAELDEADTSAHADELLPVQSPTGQPAQPVESEQPAQTAKRKRSQVTDPPAFKQTSHAEEPSHRYASMRPHRSARDHDWNHGNWKLKVTQVEDVDESVSDPGNDDEYWKEMYMSNIKRLMDAYDEGYDEAEVLMYRVHVTHKFVDGELRKIPQSYEEATSPEFYDNFWPAICDELDSYHVHSALDLENIVDVPVDERTGVKFKPINLMWIFDIKVNEDGSLKRYKARLVAKGFMQRKGESYDEVFAPTASKESIKMLLAIASMYALDTFQLDIKTAFLNGVMPEEDVLYARIPLGFDVREGNEKKVVRVKKAVYGTKQASRVWNDDLNGSLRKLGFEPVYGDPCVYIRWEGSVFVMIVVYVDDIFGTGTGTDGLLEFKRKLAEIYDVTDLGKLCHVLGAVVIRNEDGSMILNNGVYIDNLAKEFYMEEARTADIPASPEDYLHHELCPSLQARNFTLEKNYRSLIGSLMFAAVFWRPDILTRVGHLARFLHCPGERHYTAALLVLRYLKGSRDLGIFYQRAQGVSADKIRPCLIAYCDSNFANDADAVSTTGCVIMLVDKSAIESGEAPVFNCIMALSKRQSMVAQSTGEAEWIAANKTTREILHKRSVCDDLRFQQEDATIILTDSDAAVKMGKSWKVGARTRHINKIFHLTRSEIKRGSIELVHTPGGENVADMFTKFLAKQLLYKFRSRIMQ